MTITTKQLAELFEECFAGEKFAAFLNAHFAQPEQSRCLDPLCLRSMPHLHDAIKAAHPVAQPEASKEFQASLMRSSLIPDERVHRLNVAGLTKADLIAGYFDQLLADISAMIPTQSRETSLVRTHLELASFYAKKAMASQRENQDELT